MNAGTEELSVGAMVAGMLVLGTLGCSLLMIAFWLVRYLQLGYVLPDANRGYLRVPLGGTIVGIVVGLLLATLATLVSIMPVPAEEFAAANQKMTPDMMWGPILHTLLMDLILFGIFGSVVFAFSFQSRVRGPAVLFPEVSGQSAAAAPDAATSDYAAPEFAAVSELTDGPDVRSAVPSVTNPYGASDSPDHYSYLSTPSADSIVAPSIPAERFSFLREVRFAGEVFLASYFPTTVFRFIIIILISAITGEQPDQHPFLEMMKEGIGLPLMAMIFVMAVILAPVVEELFYRIIILGGLCQKGSVHIGMIVSCLLFSFAHGFPDSLALLPLAAALGYTYVRRQSYVTVMLVHFFFNAFNMVIAGVGLL